MEIALLFLLAIIVVGGFRFLSTRSREVIKDPRILVCDIGNDQVLRQIAESDGRIYSAIFKRCYSQHFDTAREFIVHLSVAEYDVVHFVATFDDKSRVKDTTSDTSDQAIFEAAKQAGVKWLFSAGSNEKAFITRELGPIPMHLVATLDRRGEKFGSFLGNLLLLLVEGKSMPMSWIKLAPQNPNVEHDAPESLFIPGRGQALFVK